MWSPLHGCYGLSAEAQSQLGSKGTFLGQWLGFRVGVWESGVWGLGSGVQGTTRTNFRGLTGPQPFSYEINVNNHVDI